MKIESVPLSQELGVELRGFDLADPAAGDALRKAFRDHHLVLIRDIGLSDDEGTALTEFLGPVSFASPVMKQGGERKFSYISNQHSEGKLRDGELLFHADHTFFKHPLKAISLYSLAAPNEGGETVFANAAGAYARLPQALKDRIAGLEARHMASYGAFEGSARPVFDPNSKAKVHVHPVVWPHPETGAPILLVSRLLTESIIGLSSQDSEDLLEELFSHIEDPRFHYVHKWREQDFLVWDNRQLQHSRRDFAPTEKRALRRVPIAEPASLLADAAV